MHTEIISPKDAKDAKKKYLPMVSRLRNLKVICGGNDSSIISKESHSEKRAALIRNPVANLIA